MNQSLAEDSLSIEAQFLPARQDSLNAPDIATLFPHGALTSCEVRSHWDGSLHGDELVQLGNVCEKRQAEFAAGRNCARKLIAIAKGTSPSIAIGDDRQPVWPQGIVGSISHADEICAVVVGHADHFESLGVDVELLEDLDRDVLDIVLTENERNATRELGGWSRKLIFSIKESIYKCCYSKVRTFIDFHDCEVQLDTEHQSYSAVVNCRDQAGDAVFLEIEGKWLIEAGHIFTSAVLER